jgi:hypothetical protein
LSSAQTLRVCMLILVLIIMCCPPSGGSDCDMLPNFYLLTESAQCVHDCVCLCLSVSVSFSLCSGLFAAVVLLLPRCMLICRSLWSVVAGIRLAAAVMGCAQRQSCIVEGSVSCDCRERWSAPNWLPQSTWSSNTTKTITCSWQFPLVRLVVAYCWLRC